MALGADGKVDIGDLNAVLGKLMATGPGGDGTWNVVPFPAGYECADVAQTSMALGPDGRLDIGDLNAILGKCMAAGPGGDGTWKIAGDCIVLP
jgi:hypothetical protein